MARRSVQQETAIATTAVQAPFILASANTALIARIAGYAMRAVPRQRRRPPTCSTTAGVVFGIVLIVSMVLVGVVSAFYTKLSSGSTRFTFEQLHQWEVETGGKHWCQRYRVKASRLLIQWLCIENTFALSVEVTNAMAYVR